MDGDDVDNMDEIDVNYNVNALLPYFLDYAKYVGTWEMHVASFVVVNRDIYGDTEPSRLPGLS